MPHSTDHGNSVDTGLASLATLARLHDLAVDPDRLAQNHGQPGRLFDEREILLAGRQLGLKIRSLQSSWQRLQKTPLPAIGQHRDGHWFVIAACDRDKVLLQDPLERRPLTLPRELFQRAWCGRLILASPRAPLESQSHRFGFGWFIPAILKYRGLLLEVLAASFFIQLFALVTPLLFQVVIDKVLVHKGLTTLDVLAVGLLGVALFEVVLGGLRGYLFSHTSNRVDVTLGARLFKHLLALPVAYFEARPVGSTAARVRELENIRAFLTGSALTLIIDLFFTLVFFVALYLYSPTLMLVVLAGIPLYIALSLLVTPVLRRRLEEKFDRGAANQAFLVESVTGIETLKAAAVEPQMQRRWETQLAAYVAASFRATQLSNIATQSAQFINKVTTVLILWLGASLVIRGELSLGQLIAFNMLAARVSAPILRLVQTWQDFQQAGVSMRRLGDIFNAAPEPGHRARAMNPPALRGTVRFNDVTFRYLPQQAPVLSNLELACEAGEVVGIVGRSGTGKSTLGKLLQRLHVPETGRVLVDGMDLALLDPSWLRRQIGVVLQENHLFNCSVRDNIALGHSTAPARAVIEAARMAGAHDFILQLPQGYDTEVGERGSNLSGGQRQRIAIARALLSNPRILILDEATSALDYESERLIQRNMRRICEGRTVFIISHRLSTIRHCDRIVVIEQGQVVEQGSHRALLRLQGRYASLHALQAEAG